MAAPPPRSLSIAEQRGRLNRIRLLAKKLGFVGVVEYRHVYSQAGGAQYGRAITAEEDLLIVYAEAFERDANPEDYSLAAILAHERGHQLLARHPRIARQVEGRISDASEEILASVLGSLLCDDETDRDNLIFKAVAELTDRGESLDAAFKRLQELRDLFEALL